MGKSEEKGLAYQIMDVSDQALYVVAKDDFRILYANPKAKEIFGDNLEKGTCYQEIASRQRPCIDCPYMHLQIDRQFVNERYLDSFDRKVSIKADEIIWENGEKVILFKVLDSDVLLEAKYRNDMWSKEHYAEKLRQSGELYQAVVSQLKTMVFEYDYRNCTSYTSALFQEKFGVEQITDIDFTKDPETLVLICPEDQDIYKMLFTGREDDFREVTCRLQEKNGSMIYYRICVQFIRDEDGQLVRAIGTLKNEDEIARSRATIKYQSEYDALTDIPNVNRFYIDASHMIQDDREGQYAVISFDVDKFKMINDLFGMMVGDDVLRHIANVLKEALPENALYCRVHSDVFFICISYNRRGDLIKLIEKVRKGIYKNSFSFDINTSFGIYLVQDTSIPINLMCDRASLAARTVKSSVMEFCAFYDEQYREEIIKSTEIEMDMNQALSDRQFLMYLQPKYNLATGTICGAEVLARWQHPLKGLIQPGDFIPLFERNGFILKLDEYMWEQACQTLANWRKEGIEPVPLSVNISRYHIRNNDLVHVWKHLIKKYDILTSDLTLEITETFFHDSEDLYSILQELQSMGFRLEVDDFGSGYSSLNMIRQVPIDTIKIDRNFLDQKLASDKGKIVISHTIAMAKDLKLDVVAEGVETKEHVDFLKSTNCDIAQGYFFAKPMPLEDFNRLLFQERSS